MQFDIEAILKEEAEEKRRSPETNTGKPAPASKARTDEETSSPSEKKSVPRSVKPKRTGAGYTTLTLSRELASRLTRIQLYHYDETDEKLSMGAIIERLLAAGIEPAFGEKVARKVAKMR